MNETCTVFGLTKGSEVFVFRFPKGMEVRAVEAMVEEACGPSSFDWYDAALLSYSVGLLRAEVKNAQSTSL